MDSTAENTRQPGATVEQAPGKDAPRGEGFTRPSAAPNGGHPTPAPAEPLPYGSRAFAGQDAELEFDGCERGDALCEDRLRDEVLGWR